MLSVLLLLILAFGQFQRVIGGHKTPRTHQAWRPKHLETALVETDKIPETAKDTKKKPTQWHYGHGMFAELDAILDAMDKDVLV